MDADVYLDAASAMPLRPEARAAVVEALDAFGDPLTIHGPARAARAIIDDARVTIGRSIGAQADEIVFTSGGTESVALAIGGAARAQRETGNRIVVSTVEHPAVGGICNVLAAD
ncbi:MAG: aminotransferase class V-fold PLP-dependent enzyme, partial [Actinomycetota bacterium]|nr:aminotransferase class V-fold PLP-dependent enzyme [Actinomycetota bacterium]